MRGLTLFVAGTLVGLAATSLAQNQSPNRGVVGINHVALAVPDIEKAVEVILKKGIVKAAARAGKVAAEGEVRTVLSADKRKGLGESPPSGAYLQSRSRTSNSQAG